MATTLTAIPIGISAARHFTGGGRAAALHGGGVRPVELAAGTSDVFDVLDRILDKGVVIDAWIRLSVIGIELVTVQAQVVVASIATYLDYADSLLQIRGASTKPE